MRSLSRISREALAPYLLEPSTPPSLVDWRLVYGNDHPVEVEVGFGKGLFLTTASSDRPESNFLGIELVRKYQLLTASRLAKRGLGNVRVAKAEANSFLRDCVPPGSVQTMHVYFPDPWWKRRHLKRRLFNAEFVFRCTQVLRPAGRLEVATDVPEYFTVIRRLVASRPEFRALPIAEPNVPVNDLDYLTSFERKFRKQGKPIHRGVWELAAPLLEAEASVP